MKLITKPQISKLHVLLTNLGLIDQKAEIVYNFTEGRTESTKELTIQEARQLITNLSEYDPKERIKAVIFSLAYKAGIIYGSTDEDKKINTAKLNMFLRERGAVKKELNQMDYTELVKVHRQFEAIVKSNAKSTENKQADKAVRNLLEEINIPTK